MSDPFAYADEVRSVGILNTHVAVVPSEVVGREDLFRCLIRSLKLPSHFGSNWDALDECLRDLSWLTQNRVVLFHEALPELGRDPLTTYLEILRDAVVDWRSDVDDELVVVLPPSARDEVRRLLTS